MKGVILTGGNMEELLQLLHSRGVREVYAAGAEPLEGAVPEGMTLLRGVEGRPGSDADRLLSCLPRLGKENFFVAKGGALCDFDLERAIEFHREKGAGVTMLLGETAEQRGAGLVEVDGEGRVVRFAEPSLWRCREGLLADTGLFLINPQVLEDIPRGEGLDLAAEVLPVLAEEKRGVYGFPVGPVQSREERPSPKARRIRFGEDGVISGFLGDTVGPELLMALGNCLGGAGKVAIGHWGGMGALMLAQAAASGARAAGGRVLHHTLETPAQGAWLARQYQLPISLFVEQQGERVFLHLFDREGLHIGRSRGQTLEQALSQGRLVGCRAGRIGEGGLLQVSLGDYCAQAVKQARLGRFALRRVKVAVPGMRPEDRGLKQCLKLLGCSVEEEWRKGIPQFGAAHGGFYLTARDERGSILEPEQLLPLLCLLEMEHGAGAVALPDGASAAAELVAAGFGGQCLRLGKDGAAARRLYAAQPWMWDAAFAAVRIASRMSATGERLEALMSKTPRFSLRKREVPLHHPRARVMGELAGEPGLEIVGEGLRLRAGNGWVFLVPHPRRQALRVLAESQDMELAAELCDFYAGRAQLADRRLQGEEEK